MAQTLNGTWQQRIADQLDNQAENKSAYGETVTVVNRPYIQNTCPYNIIHRSLEKTTSGSGTATAEDIMFTVKTGTTLGSYAEIVSSRAVHFKPGESVTARFSGIFPDSVAGSESGVGFFTANDELSFGHNGTTFGIWHRYNGKVEVQELTITAAATTATDLTLVLNDEIYTIPLTVTTIEGNAQEIANYISTNSTTWNADQLDDTVIFNARKAGARTGTYSYTHADSTGTFSETGVGVAPTSTHHPQSSWNKDVAEWLDSTDGNVYDIRYDYMGFGSCNFYVQNPETSLFVLVHVVNFQDETDIPLLSNGSMNMGLYVKSNTSTTDTTVRSAAISAFKQGMLGFPNNPLSASATQSINTDISTNVLTLRNRLTVNGVLNKSDIKPFTINVSSEGSKVVIVEIILEETVSGVENFTKIEDDGLVDISTVATTYTTGTILFTLSIQPNGSQTVDLTPLDLRIAPGEKLFVGARTAAAAAVDVTAAISYLEDY